jgi:hypothetical protein
MPVSFLRLLDDGVSEGRARSSRRLAIPELVAPGLEQHQIPREEHMELDQSARYSDLRRKEDLIAPGKPIFVAYRNRPKAGNS